MIALRQQHVHTGVDLITQSDYDAITTKDPSVLYIIVASIVAEPTIQNVYIGTIPQLVLVDNANNIVWLSSTVNLGSGNTLTTAELVNLV